MTTVSEYLEVYMPNYRCPVARWQHVDVWREECWQCGREIEFSVKMNGEDGYYQAYWNKHSCEVGNDSQLLGEVTWVSAQTLTSLRGYIQSRIVMSK